MLLLQLTFSTLFIYILIKLLLYLLIYRYSNFLSYLKVNLIFSFIIFALGTVTVLINYLMNYILSYNYDFVVIKLILSLLFLLLLYWIPSYILCFYIENKNKLFRKYKVKDVSGLYDVLLLFFVGMILVYFYLNIFV